MIEFIYNGENALMFTTKDLLTLEYPRLGNTKKKVIAMLNELRYKKIRRVFIITSREYASLPLVLRERTLVEKRCFQFEVE